MSSSLPEPLDWSTSLRARWIFVGVVAVVGAGLIYGIGISPPLIVAPPWLNLPWDWTWLGSQQGSFLSLAAMATTIGLPFAVIAAFGVRHQASLQRQIAQEQSSRECMFRFTEEWNHEITSSDAIPKTSRLHRALEVLKNETWKSKTGPDARGFIGEKDDDVNEVLNFFDKVAYLRRRGDLDRDLAWNAFGNNPVTFAQQCHEFILAYRLGEIRRSTTETKAGDMDMTYWQDFEWWVNELGPYDRQKTEEANKEYERKKAAGREKAEKAEKEGREKAEKEGRKKAEKAEKADDATKSS